MYPSQINVEFDFEDDDLSAGFTEDSVRQGILTLEASNVTVELTFSVEQLKNLGALMREQIDRIEAHEVAQ